MANSARRVSPKLLQAIKDEKVSKNTVIYYEDGVGWMCQKRSMPLVKDVSVTDRACPLQSLGPFGTQPAKVSITLLLGMNMYTTSLNPRLRRLVNNDDSESVGQHAPLTPVTLQGVARDVARIPRQATHFCWVYPPAGLTQLSAESKALLDREIADGDPEHSFFAFGGFVYFRLDGSNYQMLQANALIKADNGLTFEGPFDWRPAYTAQLARDGRFQDVTVSSLLDFGIKYYCFINPNERLKSSTEDAQEWTPAPNGAFVYLYESTDRPHRLDRYFTIADAPVLDQENTRAAPLALTSRPKRRSIPQQQLDSHSSSPSRIERDDMNSPHSGPH